MLTLAEIKNAENSVKRVRVILQDMGREIYRIREGRELSLQYGFERYSLFNFSGSHCSEQEGPDWPIGTPIFSLLYYWPRAEDTISVTFPVGWLGQDWRALETARVEQERREKAERLRAEEAERVTAQAAAERETYERLKAKFGETDNPVTPSHPEGAG